MTSTSVFIPLVSCAGYTVKLLHPDLKDISGYSTIRAVFAYMCGSLMKTDLGEAALDTSNHVADILKRLRSLVTCFRNPELHRAEVLCCLQTCHARQSMPETWTGNSPSDDVQKRWLIGWSYADNCQMTNNAM